MFGTCRTFYITPWVYQKTCQKFQPVSDWRVQELIRDDVELAQLVRARDCWFRGRRFDSGKNIENPELKSTWIWTTET